MNSEIPLLRETEYCKATHWIPNEICYLTKKEDKLKKPEETT